MQDPASRSLGGPGDVTGSFNDAGPDRWAAVGILSGSMLPEVCTASLPAHVLCAPLSVHRCGPFVRILCNTTVLISMAPNIPD